MKVEVKRLYNGVASVRDYMVQRAIDREEDLTIVLTETGEEWRIRWADIKSKGKLDKSRHVSRFNGGSYHLVDFKWPAKKEEPTEKII